MDQEIRQAEELEKKNKSRGVGKEEKKRSERGGWRGVKEEEMEKERKRRRWRRRGVKEEERSESQIRHTNMQRRSERIKVKAQWEGKCQ